MRKTLKHVAAITLAVMLAIPVTATTSQSDAVTKKAPTLTVGMKSLFGTASTTVKVNKNKVYKIVKTTWSLNEAGKEAVKLTKKTNSSVKVTALNVNGKATLTAKIKYKATKKAKTTTKKLTVKFSTDTNGKSDENDNAQNVLIDVMSPDWVSKLDAAQTSDRIAVVAAFDEGATSAWFSYHEKSKEDGKWHMLLTTPAFIGKNGLGKTKEGDAKTPTGTYTFNRAFGIADDPGCNIPYKKVTEDDYWSGDPDYHYNELVDIKDYPTLALDDSEHIIDYKYHYQYCLNISYNAEGTPGLGSAIFLHCFGPAKPYTGGCVAIPEAHMKAFMQVVDSDTSIVIDTAKTLFDEEWPDSTWPGIVTTD